MSDFKCEVCGEWVEGMTRDYPGSTCACKLEISPDSELSMSLVRIMRENFAKSNGEHTHCPECDVARPIRQQPIQYIGQEPSEWRCDDCWDSAAERIAEHEAEAYYGGSGPEPLARQQAAAQRLK